MAENKTTKVEEAIVEEAIAAGAKTIFHPSIEGAQHGKKSLRDFLKLAKAAGAVGAQPSNFHLHGKDGRLMTAKQIRDIFAEFKLKIDGISCHCPFWVHTTAWTGSPSILPFISAEVARKSAPEIEKWAENYLFELFDLAKELGVMILPMFWGVAFGWELATGFPWGFWKGGGFDFFKEGQDRFVNKTAKLRDRANKLGLYLAHEIHPGTAGMCADDFNMLVEICGGDKCMAVNIDPSHCWEGESWQTRIAKVASRIYACHVKNHVIRPNLPLRMMVGDWQKRAMQFVDINTGDINMTRFTEALIAAGYANRYCQIMKTSTAPLIVEVESAFRDGDATSIQGIQYVRDNLCFPIAAGSFEDGMGA